MDKDELVGLEIDHIKVNQPDLGYCISLIDDEIAQIYAIHHKNPTTCGMLIMHQIEEAVRNEAVYRADQRIENKS